MTPRELLTLCREKDVKAVDFRFTDLLGTWHHTTIPISQLSEELFDDGLGFDGSSIRGWKSIDQSDMLMLPLPATAFLDPFTTLPTLNVLCTIVDPITRENYSRDPRNIAEKAATYVKSVGIADKVFVGPECEFFIFDDVQFDQTAHSGFYYVDSVEGQWNRGRNEQPNLGNKIRHQGGYFPVPPTDQMMDIRNDMMQTMIKSGLEVECHHHEVGSAGQSEIDLKFGELVGMADHVMRYKYIVKNVARRHGKTATFMPKPIFEDNGNGMHTHFSFWRDDAPLFAGAGYAGLSDTALYAIGGVLKHAAAVLAFSNPTTNSYKRLVPGYEAPVLLAYSQRNRSAACRIPMYSSSPNSKRVEFRCPDPSCNPYLAFAAITMAAIDGIQNKIDPGEAMDENLYETSHRHPEGIQTTPANLYETMNALESDHEFLLNGEVFTSDVIDTWLQLKRNDEADAVRSRPHPYEFCLYYDV